MSDLELKLLDPLTDIELFRKAYNWRIRPKKHVQPDRMPFEVFSASDPLHIAVGVFNGEVLAIFFFHEFQPGCFESHFTSKRGTSRETLIEGGRLIRDAFLQNGAVELCAWVTKRNTALKNYLEALNFSPVEEKEFYQKPFIRYQVTRPV